MIGEAWPSFPSEFSSHPSAEIIRQYFDVSFAHPQRRQSDYLETEAIEKVGPKFTPPRLVGKIFIGGGNDPYVHSDWAGRSDPRNLSVFDSAQKTLLGAHGKSAQFVKKEGSLVGLLEPSHTLFGCACERPSFVSEQFGFDQGFRQCGAIHRYQWLAPPCGQTVEAFGDQLLPGTPLTDNEDGPAHRRGSTRTLYCVEKGTGLPDELVFTLHSQDIGNFPKAWQ